MADLPQNVGNKHNSAWVDCIQEDGKLYKSYQSEEDIVHCVRNYIGSILDALKIGLHLGGEIGIKHIRPDLCALLVDNHLVGVIEVKLPGVRILEQPTVVGELYDQMLLVSRFYGTGPVIGILTSGEDWMICWFPDDNQHFGESFQLEEEEQLLCTPVRKARERPRNSPPGGTPSQQQVAAHHVIEEKEEDTVMEPEDVYSTDAPDRLLACSGIIMAECLLATLCTALTRMSRARAGHYDLRSSIFMFKLRKDTISLTWHPASYDDVVKRVNFDKFPRTNTKTLLAIEDLGRGSSGRCWLCATTSASNAAVCVLKYRNREEHTNKLRTEQSWWKEVYPEFKTRVESWCGTLALLMPHFSTIPEGRRPSFKEPLRRLLFSKFESHQLVHADVRWRNIGSYKSGEDGEIPVVYDLDSVRQKAEGDEGWVERSIDRLYPTDVVSI